MVRSAYFEYSGENTRNVSFPLGGIGAGCIGLGGDGRLRDWEIYNRPSKGTVNGFSHFAVRAEQSGEVLDTRVLHGPFQGSLTGEYVGPVFNSYGFGVRREYMAGFPGFEHCVFRGPYPVAALDFSDVRFPGSVRMQAFSPFIPMQSRESSLPTAMFEFAFTNTTKQAIDYTLFGCLAFDFNNDALVAAEKHGGRTTIVGRSAVDPKSTSYSELAIATDCEETSYQRHFYRGGWFDALEVYWRDISSGGPLKDRWYYNDSKRVAGAYRMAEHSTLACHARVAPGATTTLRVAISWYVPNVSKYWISQSGLLDEPRDVPTIWKNYYATQWDGVAAVSNAVFGDWQRLAESTKRFQERLLASTLPDPVLDAVSANISVLKTATALRLEDGTFYGWEGCHPDAGSCEGSCTHVWNYQQALPFLFPDLERSMREADYAFNQIPATGGMAFRLSLPLGIGTANHRPCADGQFGNVLKTYRDWKLSGDDDWLRKLWPNVKAAIAYAWHPGNYDKWDPDKSGVLTGRQHHTLDMELFGPNAWLSGFYLGALLAGARMAEALGDGEAETEFREIYDRGRAFVHEHLFNGSYFIQQIDLKDRGQLAKFETKAQGSNRAPESIYDLYWSDEYQEVKYQIADGCEIDQVLAQWHASLYGLGDIFEPPTFATAVRSVHANNFKKRLGDVANPCRVFGVADEAGTLICTWPDGAARPAIPLPYHQETQHGYEYAFGGQLFLIGEIEKGIEVFAAIRDRYRGHNRNPWNEVECGSNYARSMASYAAVPILSGFGFDMGAGRLSFAPKLQMDGHFNSIWSAGTAWGVIEISDGNARLSVEGGSLSLTELIIQGVTLAAHEFKRSGAKEVPIEGQRAVFGPGESLDIRDPRLGVRENPDFASNRHTEGRK